MKRRRQDHERRIDTLLPDADPEYTVFLQVQCRYLTGQSDVSAALFDIIDRWIRKQATEITTREQVLSILAHARESLLKGAQKDLR